MRLWRAIRFGRLSPSALARAARVEEVPRKLFAFLAAGRLCGPDLPRWNDEELFDFKEPVWFNVSEELKEFMLLCVAIDPRQRSTIGQLLSSEFISMSSASNKAQKE